MRGVYTISDAPFALSTAKTALLITAAANKTLEVLEVTLTAASIAAAMQMACGLQRVTTIGSAAGATPDVAKHEKATAAHGFVPLTNLTTEPTTYEVGVVGFRGFAHSIGYYWIPQPEDRVYIIGGQTWGLRVLTAPSSPFNAIVTCTVREIA